MRIANTLASVLLDKHQQILLKYQKDSIINFESNSIPMLVVSKPASAYIIKDSQEDDMNECR